MTMRKLSGSRDNHYEMAFLCTRSLYERMTEGERQKTHHACMRSYYGLPQWKARIVVGKHLTTVYCRLAPSKDPGIQIVSIFEM